MHQSQVSVLWPGSGAYVTFISLWFFFSLMSFTRVEFFSLTLDFGTAHSSKAQIKLLQVTLLPGFHRSHPLLLLLCALIVKSGIRMKMSVPLFLTQVWNQMKKVELAISLLQGKSELKIVAYTKLRLQGVWHTSFKPKIGQLLVHLRPGRLLWAPRAYAPRTQADWTR